MSDSEFLHTYADNVDESAGNVRAALARISSKVAPTLEQELEPAFEVIREALANLSHVTTALRERAIFGAPDALEQAR